MAILRKILIYILPLMLTGCYEDFVPDIDVTPVLCINSLITAGEPVEVNVSRTWLYTDVQSEKNHSVSDAAVSVYANGELVGADYLPREGDRIRIVADSPTYGHAEAEVTVPHSVEARVVGWEADNIVFSPDYYAEDYEMSGTLRFNLKVKLEVPDDPAVDNYYRVAAGCFYPGNINDDDDNPAIALLSAWDIVWSAEPIFSEHIGVIESVMGATAYGCTFFSDRQFSGKSYTLRLNFEECSYTVVHSDKRDPALFDCGVMLTLNTISRSYYNWVNYLWQSSEGLHVDLSNIGMTEPMAGYSNVSTGAGIVVAQASTTTTVNLADFLADQFPRKESPRRK